eukprot:gnl/Hemi2/25372_TR8540_c0_g1_i1.p1 gnl/Hemi2/25372_TR8540_c0_g1~~gnl/Hemi2/25372_TR8540_c0_g1_i1.p1  ORF type:complete len:448 (-),score=116.24 gnl/Hemi2/25372_TR8540_c0_g1_i1:179-1522(-)
MAAVSVPRSPGTFGSSQRELASSTRIGLGNLGSGNTNIYQGRFADRFPDHPTAGVLVVGNGSAGECLAPDRFEPRATTPPKQRRFLKYSEPEVGKAVSRFTTAPPVPPTHAFGAKNQIDATAADCIPFKSVPDTVELIKQTREQIYASNKKPLGKTVVTSHGPLPERTNNPNFKFGCSTKPTENVKHLLFPVGVGLDRDDPKVAAAAQKTRNYNWAATKVDPFTHRFGKSEPVTHDQVKTALNPELDPDIIRATPTLETDSVMSARQKSAGAHGFNARADMAPAGSKVPFDGFTGRDLLTGTWYGNNQPDTDVGKRRVLTTANHWRPAESNIEKTTRAAGVPLIRTDRDPPKKKSVLDVNNYGYDPQIKNIIQPPSRMPFFDEGKDLVYSRDELRDIVLGSEMGMSEEEFLNVFNLAVGLASNGAPNSSPSAKITVDQFRAALSSTL